MPKRGGNISLTSYDDIFETDESRAESQLERVQNISISELVPFKDHPFKVVDDEAMLRTTESIAQYGVLTPLIARPLEGGGYEIISGHRRAHAAEMAGLTEVPVLVRQMDDDAATVLMVDSNLQRENILPSERAYAYKMKLEAMKRQAGKVMLRKCKLEVVVAESVHCYNEITKSKEDFIMKLSDKIVRLRKSNGMSQEELADKLGVSRQAISRWEMGTAMPDATNILQLSRLFQVTTDYLLNDEYQSDNDLPKVKEVKTDGIHQIMIFLITLEVMVLIIQFMSVMILQNIFFGVLSFIPFIAMVGGFEYAYQKKANEQNERTIQFRKRFYKVSAWLGTYFPIRLLAMALVHFYPRPINSLALECVIAVLYLMTATFITLEIEKRHLSKN